MRLTSKSAVIGVSAALLSAGAVVVALAGEGDPVSVPEGPAIDFCPTTEQIEAHLQQYGFDYKPTVTCAEGGEEVAPGQSDESQDTEKDTAQALADLQQKLLTAERAPDTDGDPLTMEIVFADGTKTTLLISGNADRFKDVTPAELARGDTSEVKGEAP